MPQRHPAMEIVIGCCRCHSIYSTRKPNLHVCRMFDVFGKNKYVSRDTGRKRNMAQLCGVLQDGRLLENSIHLLLDFAENWLILPTNLHSIRKILLFHPPPPEWTNSLIRWQLSFAALPSLVRAHVVSITEIMELWAMMGGKFCCTELAI